MFNPLVMKAAKEALEQWDKFIPEAMENLVRRFRFEPMTPPPAMPAPKTAQYRSADAADFFGGWTGAIDVECIADWAIYREKWPSIPDRMKALGIGKFWNDPEVVKCIFGLPDAAVQLRKFATWWADQPTSSVAVERAFGIMRGQAAHAPVGGERRPRAADARQRLDRRRHCRARLRDSARAQVDPGS